VPGDIVLSGDSNFTWQVTTQGSTTTEAAMSTIATKVDQNVAPANPHVTNNPWRTNPRGWFGNQSLQITDPTNPFVLQPGGSAVFLTAMTNFIQGCINDAHNLLHGPTEVFLFWDIEGEQYNNGPIVYVGNPGDAWTWAPEWGVSTDSNSNLDQIVAKIKNAGFKMGFTLRQSKFVPASPKLTSQLSGHGFIQNSFVSVDEAVADLDARVTLVKNRWGACFFYVDSSESVPPYKGIDSGFHIYEALQKLHPN
jgi:hypothetical protein